MKFYWPEDYKERIEKVLGAKYQTNGQISFLSIDVDTPREGKQVLEKINLMQKGLRQIKSELKIKSKNLQFEAQNVKNTPGLMKIFSKSLINQKANMYGNYQTIISNIDNLLNMIQREKIELEEWIILENTKGISNSFTRELIPEEIQIFVWNRDGGKCVKCGSNINLEYDHIIPVSRGGSNTARNIQLLCETCNRKKSNSIGS